MIHFYRGKERWAFGCILRTASSPLTNPDVPFNSTSSSRRVPPPCIHCRHNTTAGPHALYILRALLWPPRHQRVSLPCHAPGHLATARPAVRSPAGPEPGIFPRGALEPRISAPRSPGCHRAGLPQLGALSAAVPRNHRAPRLPKGPHCALVSASSLGNSAECQSISCQNFWNYFRNISLAIQSRKVLFNIRVSSGAPGTRQAYVDTGKLCVRLRVRLWVGARWWPLCYYEDVGRRTSVLPPHWSDQTGSERSESWGCCMDSGFGARRARCSCRIVPMKDSIQS